MKWLCGYGETIERNDNPTKKKFTLARLFAQTTFGRFAVAICPDKPSLSLILGFYLPFIPKTYLSHQLMQPAPLLNHSPNTFQIINANTIFNFTLNAFHLCLFIIYPYCLNLYMNFIVFFICCLFECLSCCKMCVGAVFFAAYMRCDFFFIYFFNSFCLYMCVGTYYDLFLSI